MIQLKCQTCNSLFNVFPCRKSSRFCSKKCYRREGQNNPKWRGGTFLCGGYRYIYSPDHPNAIKSGYVVEHRLVVEQSIGRILSRSEVIHHMDGNPLNNKIENLVICQSSGRHVYDEHVKGHDKNGRFKYK